MAKTWCSTRERRVGVGALCLLALGAACAPSAPGRTPGQSAAIEQTRRLGLESFDAVWATVRDSHWDPELGGVDWAAVREEMRPRIALATSRESVREILTGTIDRLEQSHFAIIPAEVYGDVSAPGPERGGGVTGLSVRVRDERALVAAVDPALPVAHLDVRPGWVIAAVDGNPTDAVIRRVGRQYAGSTLLAGMTSLAVEAMLAGPVGHAATVEFVDGDGAAVFADVPRVPPPGTPASLGHLPTLYLTRSSERVHGDVGYIAFSAFLDPAALMAWFQQELERHRDASGIILDLRGNPGGIGAMAMGIGGWFVTEPDQFLGTMRTRDVSLRFVLNPRRGAFAGPLAILTDGRSMSTSEILAGGLQDLGRARVFGSRSAGAALPSKIERLPNGDGFQYAFANYVSVGGRTLEGRGVEPDVRIEPDRESLLAGVDPVIRAAAEWIHEETKP